MVGTRTDCYASVIGDSEKNETIRFDETVSVRVTMI